MIRSIFRCWMGKDMPLTHTSYCPTCRAERAQHVYVGRHRFTAQQNDRFLDVGFSQVWNAYFRCTGCDHPRALLLQHKYSDDIESLNGETASIAGLRISWDIPERPTLSIPSHCPSNIAAAYMDAAKSFDAGLFNPSAMASRRTADLTTQHLKPGKDTFYKRIDALHKEGKLTTELKDWAHLIRLDGNEANHGEAATEEEAQELLDFTELFLTYVYTLPGRIKDRQKTVVEPEAGEVAVAGHAPEVKNE